MSMVAAGIGKLVDEGKLEWTTLLKSVIPEIDKGPSHWTHRVTIADILAHRSGLDGAATTLLAHGGSAHLLSSFKAMLKVAEQIPCPRGFREEWHMCPWGYVIAAHIIARISKLPLYQYLHEELFRPLGMKSTTLRPSLEGGSNVAAPHSSLSNRAACPLKCRPDLADSSFDSNAAYSTVNDLLKWAKATLAASQNTEESANTVLKEIPQILSNQIAMESPSLLERSYGFGWARAQLPGVVGLLGANSDLWEMSEQPVLGSGNPSRLMIYSQGSRPGYSSFIAIFPDTQSAVVVLTNTTAASDAADWIARILIESLFNFTNPTDYGMLAEKSRKRRLAHVARVSDTLARERSHGAPSVPLECYIGNYINEEYELTLDITLSTDDCLMISFHGMHFQCYGLRHLHDSVFEWSLSFDEAQRAGRYDVADPEYYKIRFELYPDNRASQIIWNIHNASVPHGLRFKWRDVCLEERWRKVHAGMSCSL